MPESSGQIAILLSTYNGGQYLPGQLDSFLAQTHTAWALHWRDDGSRDDSVALLRAFAAGQGRCTEHSDPPGNLGVVGSYMTLLRAAAPGLGEADAIAFADQDDVWLPEKLARGLAMLPRGEAPALYCARYVRTDALLRRLGESNRLRRPAGFPQALAQNVATGCTILLNRAAAMLVAASAPPIGTIHDWWCYLVVSAAGGLILRDEATVLLYRQHGGNAVGAAPNWPTRAVGALRRGPAQFITLLRAHVAALLVTPQLLTPRAHEMLAEMDDILRGPRSGRLKLLRWRELRRQGWWETQALRAWLVIG